MALAEVSPTQTLAATTAPTAKAESSSSSPAAAGTSSDAVAATTTKLESGRRVPLWNVVYRRRISGNSAPMEQNLEKYLKRHPECEIYAGQDLPTYAGGDQEAKRQAALQALAARPVRQLQKRVTLWHKIHKRKVVGNAAPLEKNVDEYLRKHPEFELYDAFGDKREKSIAQAVERVLGAIVTSVCSAHKHSPSRQLQRQRQKAARLMRSKGGAIGKRRPLKTLQTEVVDTGNQGMSLLVNIAVQHGRAPLPSTDSLVGVGDACGSPDFGLLDLLAAVTTGSSDGSITSGTAQVKPPVPSGSPSSAPESPPFSPMQGPAEPGTEAQMPMPDLSIGAAHTKATLAGSASTAVGYCQQWPTSHRYGQATSSVW